MKSLIRDRRVGGSLSGRGLLAWARAAWFRPPAFRWSRGRSARPRPARPPARCRRSAYPGFRPGAAAWSSRTPTDPAPRPVHPPPRPGSHRPARSPAVGSGTPWSPGPAPAPCPARRAAHSGPPVPLGMRRSRWIRLILACREPAARAVPGLRDRGVASEARNGLVPVAAPERDAHPRCRLAALSLAHRTRAYPAAADGVATTHCSPLAFVTSLTLAVSEPALPPPSAVQQQVERDDAEEPDDAREDRDPVQVPLDHRRRAERRRDPAAEKVGQPAALALVQEHEQHHQQARDDEDDRHSDDHCFFSSLRALCSGFRHPFTIPAYPGEFAGI